MRPYIYHITSKVEWEEVSKGYLYKPISLETEGFIHCCGKYQLGSVARRYFEGKTGLVILVIRTNKLKSRVEMETTPLFEGGSETSIYVNIYARIYGPLNTDAVTSVETFTYYMH